MDNPYMPYPVRIDDIEIATEDRSLKTFTFTFLNPADEAAFSHKAGQFAMLSIPGKGEIPIGIALLSHGKGVCEIHRLQNRCGDLGPAQHGRG